VLAKRLARAMHQAITFLSTVQEPDGSWWGRWGVNYVYGTSNVLCGLSYSNDGRIGDMVKPAVEWLKSCQQDNGGWGEALDTYLAMDTARIKPEPTASQTAWAVMGLLAYLPVSDKAIRRGIQFLIDSQKTRRDIGRSRSTRVPDFRAIATYTTTCTGTTSR
jgi:squalene-hopene/tetraprenyl-beta-curcumene cyclase